MGDVVLTDAAGSEIGARAVKFGWIGGGRYVEATDAKGADPEKCGCYVVFRDLAERNVTVTVTRRGGQGAAAVAGLQLFPAE